MSYLHLYNKKSFPKIQPETKKSLLRIASEPNRNLNISSKSAMASKSKKASKSKIHLKIHKSF